MKKNLKIIGVLFLFSTLLLAFTNKKITHDDKAIYKDIEEERLKEEFIDDAEYAIDSLENNSENDTMLLASTGLYSVFDSSGRLLGTYNRMDQALKVSNLYRIRLNSSITISYRITIPRNMILDLNGYTLTFKDREGEYFITVGKGIDFMVSSSRPNGRIVTNFNKNGIIHLAGNKSYTSAQQPVVRIGDNVTLQNNNADTIKNHSGKLYIYGGTIRPTNNSYNAILTRWEGGATNGQPVVEITGKNAKIYGIWMGQNVSGSPLYGGTVKITNGTFYPSKSGKIFGQTSSQNSLYITGGTFTTTTKNLGATNKSAYYQLVKVGNSYVMKKYSLPKFDLKGGSYVGSYKPDTYHYYGNNYNFPSATQVTYRAGQNFKFAGWYNTFNTSTYEYNGGPYTWRTATNMDNKTYYARWTYQVKFDANDVDINGKTIEQPVVGKQDEQTFNAGTGVYNKMPVARYSRQGYKLLGWSTNKNSKSTNITVDTKQSWNFDTSVSDGAVTLYAIWEPINLGSSYEVQYYLEDLNGNYNLEPTRTTRFYSTAGNTSSPSIASINGFSISQTTDHQNLRKVYVRGDGNSVVKLYYNRNVYNLTFDLGVDTNINNLNSIQQLYGEKNVNITNDVTTKVNIRFKHGQTILVPEFNRNLKTGYDFQRWDKPYNNLTNDTTITAVYTAAKYDYVFDNNGQKQTIQQTFGNKIVLPNSANLSGYTFDSWRIGNEIITKDTVISEVGSKTIHAYWKSNKPTSKVELLFRSNSTFAFTNYKDYEYQLLKDGEIIKDWVLAGGINITGLEAETTYQLNIRYKKTDGDYFLASDIVSVGEFTTLKEVETSVSTFVEGGIITITPNQGNNKVVYELQLPGSTTYVKGQKVNDSYVFNTDINSLKNPEQQYNIIYTVDNQHIDFNEDVTTAKLFNGNTRLNFDQIVISTDRKISFTADSSYQYSIDNGLTWASSDETGLFTFDELKPNTEYKLLVRNKATDTEPASYSEEVTNTASTKKPGIAPSEIEATHAYEEIIDEEIIDEDTHVIKAKEGFVYYSEIDGTRTIIDIVEGKLSVDANTRIERAANAVFAESESNTSLIIIPMPTLDDADTGSINVVVDSNTAKITPFTSEKYQYEYILGNGEQRIEGSLLDNQVYFFEGLEYGTTYKVYVNKILIGTHYESDFVDSTITAVIGKQDFGDDFDSIEDFPEFNYSTRYDADTKKHVIEILDKKVGFDYEYYNGTEWVLISGEEVINLDPNKEYQFRIRLNNDKQESEYRESYYARTNKNPQEVITHAPVNAEVIENVIKITNTIADHEYAITEITNNDYSNLEYYLHEEAGITFYEIQNIVLKYNHEYKIIVRRIETEIYEQSEAIVVQVIKDSQTNESVHTNRRLTKNVELPTKTDEMLQNISVIYNENQQLLTVDAHDGHEYVVINKKDYQKTEINLEEIVNVSTPQDNINIDGIVLSDEYLVFIRKKQTHEDEPSQYILLSEIEIKKQEPTTDGHNPLLDILIVKDDSIIIKMQAGYEYNISGSDIWVTGFDGNYSFRGLTPKTIHTISVRLPETEFYNASKDITTKDVETLIKPTEKIEAPINYEFNEEEVKTTETTISLTTREGYEYSIDNMTWISHSESGILFDGLTPNTEYPIFVRKAKTDSEEVSQSVLVLPAKTLIEKPNMDNAFNELVRTDTTITFKETVGYEYKYNDQTLPVTEDGYIVLNNLEPNTEVVFEVRRINIDVDFELLTLVTKQKGQLDEVDKLLELTSTQTTITVENGYADFLYAISIDEDETKLTFVNANEDGKVIFVDLEKNTNYFVFLKRKATDDTSESEIHKDSILTKKSLSQELNSEEKNIDQYQTDGENITFEPKTGLEYSIDGGTTWLDANNGTITVPKDALIVVRRAETADNEASTTVVATKKTPVIDVLKPSEDLVFNVEEITHNTITIRNNENDVLGLEFSVDQINWFRFDNEILVFENLKNNTSYELFVRRHETDNDLYSESVTARFNEDSETKNQVQTKKEKLDLTNEVIVIVGVDNTKIYIEANPIYKYSINGGTTWETANNEVVSFTRDSFTSENFKFMMKVDENNNDYYSDETEIINIIKYQNLAPKIVIEEVTSNSIKFTDQSRQLFSEIIVRERYTNNIVNENELLPVREYVVYGTISDNEFVQGIEDVILILVDNDKDKESFVTLKEDVVLNDNEEYVYILDDNKISRRDGFTYLIKDDTTNEFKEADNYIEDIVIYVKKLETNTTNESNEAIALIFKKKHDVPFEANITIKDITYHSITIVTEARYEYSIDGLTWQTNGDEGELVFDGLNPTTAYDILIRAKRTNSENLDDRFLESDEYVIHTVTTDSYDATEKINEFNAYAKELGVLGDEKYQEILKDLNDNYARMTNTDEIDGIYDQAIEALNEYLEAEKQRYANELIIIGQDEEDQDVQDLIDETIAKIENSKSKDEFINIIEITNANIELVKLINNDAENDEEKAIYNQAIEDISNATSPEMVNELLEKAKKDVHDLRIENAKKEILEYRDENFNDHNLDSVNEALEKALTKEEIKNILEQEKITIIKKVVEDELKKHFDSLPGINEGDNPSSDVQEIINDAVSKVGSDNYNEKEIIDTLINENKESISNKVLEEQKETAINKIINDNPNPSEQVQKEIEEAINKINDANSKSEIDTISNESQEKINTINKKDEVREELDNYFKGLEKNLVDEQSEDVKQIINDLIDSINEDNYNTDLTEQIEKAKSDIKEKHLEEEKNKLVDELTKEIEDIVGDEGLSKELEDQKQAIIDSINDAPSVEEIKDIDTLPLIKEVNKEKVNNEIDKKVDELTNGDNYSQEKKDELNKIKDDVKKKLEDNDLTPEEIRNELRDALEKIKEINVRRISNNDLVMKDNLDAKYPSNSKELFVEISNETGMKSTTNIVVSKVEVVKTNVDKINEMLKNKQVDNLDERNKLRRQTVFGQLSISLVDENGNKVTDFDGLYKVSVLLPDEFINNENITAVYIGEKLEVFTTTRERNWITFETTHFSDFYLVGDVPNTAVNIWWLIILLFIIIVLEIVIIVWKILSNNNKNILNSIILPFFATIIPANGRLIVIIEVIIIVVLAFIIAYLFLEKDRVYNIDEEDIQDDELEITEDLQDNDQPVGVIATNRPATLFSYSFQARLHLAPGETLNRYDKFKNHILRYEDVRVIKTWKHERFMYKGKTIAKIRVNGKTIRIYYNLDINDFADTKYLFEDVSSSKEHQSTPAMFVVRGNRKLKYAMELVDIYMEENEGSINNEYQEEDYIVNSFTKEQLIKKGLIKVNSISDDYKEIIFSEEE